MTNPVHILYIEDNYDNQRLVRRVLASRGYQITVAPDGTAGLAAAHEQLPDLILMDINLPGLNGYELTTKFKALERLQHVPIVAITANTTPGDRERALAAGCDGYISKPIDPRALPVQVAGYLGGSRELLPVAEAPVFMREYSQQLVTRLEDHIGELEAANARLIRLDQAKNEFLATISHELRTPLTVVHGYIDLLNMQALGPLNDDQREAVNLIRRNSHRLLRHINDLIFLQQVRSSQLDLQTIDLRDIVRSVCKDMQPQATAKQETLRCLIADDSEPINLLIDSHSVENAVRHLVDNAIAYTLEGGTVTVATKIVGQHAAVVVRDTGIGIAEDDQQRIFEPFVRLDATLAAVGGAGLGLVIARHVAEAHGGSISVESTLGTGSTFAMALPLRSA